MKLRPLADGDIALVERLYVTSGSDTRTESLIIARRDDESAIGIVDYQGNYPASGWLTIRMIAMEEAYRGWGYGSAAVRLLEEMAVKRGLGERFRADVDVKNGLGLYFWLRAGYRPATNQEAFWRSGDERDIISMIRGAESHSQVLSSGF